jgi:hypothetical protein
MHGLLQQPVWQIIDGNGDPLPGAKVYTYEAGTSTPLATYVQADSDTAASNPIVADADGRLVFWGGTDAYKIVIKDALDNTIWTLDNVTLSGGSGSGSVAVVTNIAALKALTTKHSLVQVLGYYTAYDGGGGMFYYDTASTTANDDGITIMTDDTPATGRYIRQYSGSQINVKWYGAKGNGSYDDLTAIQKAYNFAFAQSYYSLFFPKGTFYVSDTLDIDGVQSYLDMYATMTYPVTPTPKPPTIDPVITDDFQHFMGYDDQTKNPSFLPGTRIRSSWFSTVAYDEAMVKCQLRGLQMSYNYCNPNIVTIASGYAGMTNATLIGYMSSAMNKSIATNWVAGTDQGGKADAITLTNNTWYHVFAICNDMGVIDIGFDSDLTATNLLACSGYKNYRRIGSVLYATVNEIEQIVQFEQSGDNFIFSQQSVSSSIAYQTIMTGGTTNNKIAMTYAPLGYRSKLRLNLNTHPSSDVTPVTVNIGDGKERCGTSIAMEGPYRSIIEYLNSNGTINHDHYMELLCTTEQEIYLNVSGPAADYVTITVFGWQDTRGKND